MASTAAVTPETLITVKLVVGGENRRFKIPLKELGAGILPTKVGPRHRSLPLRSSAPAR